MANRLRQGFPAKGSTRNSRESNSPTTATKILEQVSGGSAPSLSRRTSCVPLLELLAQRHDLVDVKALENGGPTLVDIVSQPLQEAHAPVSEWVA